MKEPSDRTIPHSKHDPFEPFLDDPAPSSGEVRMILLEDIQDNPYQPRRNYDPAKISALSRSLSENGQLQPIVVRPLDRGGYQLIAGHRRVRAAQEARWPSVQALVRETSDDQMGRLALIENLQRQELDPLDEVDATLKLISVTLEIPASEVTALLHSVYRLKSKHTLFIRLQEVFHMLGHTTFQSFYAHKLPILKYPEDVKRLLRAGTIKQNHAKILAKLKDESKRVTLIQQIEDGTLQPTDLKEAIEESSQLLADLAKSRRIPGQVQIVQASSSDSQPWRKRVNQFESQMNKLVPSVKMDPETRKNIRDALLKLAQQWED